MVGLLNEAKCPKIETVPLDEGSRETSINETPSQRGAGKPGLVGHEELTSSDRVRMSKQHIERRYWACRRCVRDIIDACIKNQ